MRIALIATSGRIRGDEVGQLDGFSDRWLMVARALRELGHEVLVVHLAVDDRDDPSEWTTGFPTTTISFPVRGGTRPNRAVRSLRRMAGGLRTEATEHRLVRAIEGSGCDAVFVLTPRRPDVARVVAHRRPTVLFIEEAIAEGPDGWGTATGVVGRVEEVTLRRAIVRVCRLVVIAQTETEWAEGTLRRPTVVIPHSIDAGYWQAPPEGPAPSLRAHDAFVIGNFGALRNAEGLREILAELRTRPPQGRPRIVLASGVPPHDLLSEVSDEEVRWLGSVDDPRPLYRSARVTLVPSQRVRGVKTTILQGWATGCPVVTSTAAAMSVQGADGVDLLAGGSPGEIVERLYRVLDDQTLADSLRRNGLRRFEERHSAGAVGTAVAELLSSFPQ